MTLLDKTGKTGSWARVLSENPIIGSFHREPSHRHIKYGVRSE